MKVIIFSIVLLNQIFVQAQPTRAEVEAELSNPFIGFMVSQMWFDATGEGLSLPPLFPWPPDWLVDRCLRKGMTWKVRERNQNLGLNWVGCLGCNAYQGDTSCWDDRRIFCVKKEQLPRPPYDVVPHAGVMHDAFYQGWSGGYVDIAPEVKGCFIFGKVHGDLICRREFGSGWEMASHDDGRWRAGMDDQTYHGSGWSWSSSRVGGWFIWAYGNLNVSQEKIWAYVRTQPANCWD